MRPFSYLPERAKLASLVAAAIAPVPLRSSSSIGALDATTRSVPVAERSLFEDLEPPGEGPIEVRLHSFVSLVRERAGAESVFIADAEGLELASVRAEPSLIALLGEFTGVRRRVASVAGEARPLTMIVAVHTNQWLQIFWLDESAASPAIALVHRDLLSAASANKLRSIVHSILEPLR
jgi:hypothetical protein